MHLELFHHTFFSSKRHIFPIAKYAFSYIQSQIIFMSHTFGAYSTFVRSHFWIREVRNSDFSHRKPDEIFQRIHMYSSTYWEVFFYFFGLLSAHPNRLLLSLATSQINAAWFSSPSAFYSLSGKDLCPTPNSTSSMWIDSFCLHFRIGCN